MTVVTNLEIRNKLKLAGKLMELHGENPFKIRSYQTATDTVKMLDVELESMSLEDVLKTEGIGKGMAANISEMNNTGSFEGLSNLLSETPEGVVEMLGISGFGPKKIAVLWKEGNAESLEDILEIGRLGVISSLMGFAEKSQETLLKAVRFVIKSRGLKKFATVEPIMIELLAAFKENKRIILFSETSDLRRKMEVVDCLEFLIGTDNIEESRLTINAVSVLNENEKKSGPLTWNGVHIDANVPIKIHFCSESNFYNELARTTGHPKHINYQLGNDKTLSSVLQSGVFSSEEEVYKTTGMSYIVPELREGTFEIDMALKGTLPNLIEMENLKGILHSHSTYSDGKHSLRQMAEHCKSLGYEYLGISDHSQTAVYASGLQDYKVKEQQDEIINLNEELAPFKIFTGIESDILADGSLDYSDDILGSFDFIVASVHSGLNMDINKATNRLLVAIENPYTTILGHMTGRLILEREGYPVDHKSIIDACAKHKVVIEINASPYRLDIDWRWVHYAIEKGVMLSINPDAHKMDSYKDMYYGLLVGRKGGLTKEMCLNSMNLKEIESYFNDRKSKH